VTIVVQAGGHQGRPAAKAAAPPPAVRVTTVGHRLLGVTASWQLFARGPDDLLQIQLARGRITRTYVPPLDSGNPDVAFVAGARQTIIRSSDLVPGYVVPEGRQARALTGPLAVSDGRGDVLVTTGSFTVYDGGPGWDRLVPGTVVAVGPAGWLVVTCDPQYRHCRNEVIGTAGGSRRVLPGAAAAEPYYPSCPPTGVIAPDGSTAALAESGRHGRLTVHLISLRTGTTTDLGVPLSVAGSDYNSQSMAWSPDSRWLFVAAAGGRLVAVSTRTGRAESLGVALPAVDQVAIRA
jgi:hypothetical protein